MQEDIENRSVALTTKAAKMTAQTLYGLMKEALQKMKQSSGKLKEGKQSLKQLSKGGALSNVEITDDNIKAFDPVARKYNISYALQKDSSTEPPRWYVFFRAKDADAMTAAFKTFCNKMVKREADKPSARSLMKNLKEKVMHAVRDRTKHKHREGPEL